MNITNNKHLNPLLVNAISKSDSYSGDNVKKNYSVTEILNPPKIVLLTQRHRDEITEDISDKIWAVLGSLTHLLLERANDSDAIFKMTSKIRQFFDMVRDNKVDIGCEQSLQQQLISLIFNDINLKKLCEELKNDKYIVEKRLFYQTKSGIILSGQPDVYDIEKQCIEDWKLTSVFTYIYRNRPGNRITEYEKQLNIYKFLLEQAGYPVKSLKLNLIFKDWRSAEGKYDSTYPEKIEELMLKVWDSKYTKQFIEDKINEIEKYKHFDDDKIPECPAQDRWEGKTTWAVMKKDNKKASKVCFSFKDAQQYIHDTAKNMAEKDKSNKEYNEKLEKAKENFTIEKRIAQPKKCLDYCLVKDFCHFGRLL